MQWLTFVCPVGKAARSAWLGVPALGLALAVAAPATAGEIYAWRTDEGAYAFADELRRVPERYRDRVEVRPTRSLRDHDRFTPTDDAAMEVYAAGLEHRLDGLRRMNAQMEQRLAAERQAQGAPGGRVTVRFDSDGEPIVDVPPGGHAGGGEPVVIEDILARDEDGNRTRTNTVVRRGDEIISVIRPMATPSDPDFPSERDVENGEY